MPTLAVAIDSSGARRGARTARRAFRSIQTGAQTTTSSVTNLAAAMTGLSVGMRGVTTAGVGLARSMATTFGIVGAARGIRSTVTAMVGFESQMARVRAISGATEEQFRQLEVTARELGSTTRFSAIQVAQGLEELSRTGFTTVETIESINTALNLATAGNIELGEAARLSSDILNAFGLRAPSALRDTQEGAELTAQGMQVVADVIANTTQSANTNITALASALSFVGVIANQTGVSIEETAAAIGVLGDVGIQGSRAGTGLQRILTELGKESAQTDRALASLGLSAEDVSPAFNTLSEILQTFGEANLDLSAAQAIFGARGAPAILALVQQRDAFDNLTESNRESAGAVQDFADTVNDTTEGSLLAMRSAFEELQIQLGEAGLNDALRTAAEFMRDFFRLIGGEEIEDAGAGLRGLVALFEGVGDIIDHVVGIFRNSLAPALSDTAAAFLNFVEQSAESFSQFEDGSMAFAKVIEEFFVDALVTAIEEVGNFFRILSGEDVDTGIARTVADGFIFLGEKIGEAAAFFTTTLQPALVEFGIQASQSIESFGEVSEDVLEDVEGFLEDVGERINEIQRWYNDVATPALESFGETTNEVLTAVNEALIEVGIFINQIARWYLDTAIPALQLFGAETSRIVNQAIDFLNSLGESINTVARWYTDTAIPALQRFGAETSQVIGDIIDFVQDLGETIGGNFLDDVGEAIERLVGNFTIIGEEINTLIQEGITSDSLIIALERIGDAALDSIDTIFSPIADGISNLLNNAFSALGISDEISSVEADLQRLSAETSNVVRGIQSDLTEFGVNINSALSKIGEGVTEASSDLQELSANVAQVVREAQSDLTEFGAEASRVTREIVTSLTDFGASVGSQFREVQMVLNNFGSEVNQVLTQFGNDIGPIFRDIQKFGADVGDAFRRIQTTLTDFGANANSVLTEFGTTIGPIFRDVQAFGAEIGSAFRDTQTFLTDFGATANSSLTEFGMALGSRFSTAITELERFDLKFGSTFRSIQEPLTRFGADFGEVFRSVQADLTTLGAELGVKLREIKNELTSFGASANSVLTDFGGDLGEAFRGAQEDLTEFGTNLGPEFQTLRTTLTDFGSAVGSAFRDVQEFLTTFGAEVSNAFNIAQTTLTEFGAEANSVITDFGTDASVAFREVQETLTSFGADVSETVRGAISTTITELTNAGTGISAFFRGIVTTIETTFNDTVGFVETTINDIEGFVNAIPEGITNTFDQISDSISGAFDTAFESVRTAFSDLVGFIVDTWNNTFGVIFGAIENAIDAVEELAGQAAETTERLALDVFGGTGDESFQRTQEEQTLRGVDLNTAIENLTTPIEQLVNSNDELREAQEELSQAQFRLTDEFQLAVFAEEASAQRFVDSLRNALRPFEANLERAIASGDPTRIERQRGVLSRRPQLERLPAAIERLAAATESVRAIRPQQLQGPGAAGFTRPQVEVELERANERLTEAVENRNRAENEILRTQERLLGFIDEFERLQAAPATLEDVITRVTAALERLAIAAEAQGFELAPTEKGAADLGDKLERQIGKQDEQVGKQNTTNDLLAQIKDNTKGLEEATRPIIPEGQRVEPVVEEMETRREQVLRERRESLSEEAQAALVAEAERLRLIGESAALERQRAEELERSLAAIDALGVAIGDFVNPEEIERTAAALESIEQPISNIATDIQIAQDAQDAFNEKWEAIEPIVDEATSAISTMFTDIITGSSSASEALENLLRSLSEIALQSAIQGGLDAAIGSIFGTGVASAKGNVFTGGRLTPFARGGVVSSPFIFPMRNGAGLMGEAGPEGVLPLTRMANGNLGVESSGGGGGDTFNVTIVANDPNAFRKSEGQLLRTLQKTGRRGRSR